MSELQYFDEGACRIKLKFEYSFLNVEAIKGVSFGLPIKKKNKRLFFFSQVEE